MIQVWQLLSQSQSSDQSLNSLRQATLTLYRQNLALLQILSDIEQRQFQTAQHSANPWRSIEAALKALPAYVAYYAHNNKGINAL